MRTWLWFPIFALATYRLALMLESDLGPYAMFRKLRSMLKREAKQHKPLRDSKVHLGISCIRCDSVWVAVPISAYAYWHKNLLDWVTACGDVFLAAMALSAMSILIHRIAPPK